jgi:hypothetical protein
MPPIAVRDIAAIARIARIVFVASNRDLFIYKGVSMTAFPEQCRVQETQPMNNAAHNS